MRIIFVYNSKCARRALDKLSNNGGLIVKKIVHRRIWDPVQNL